MISIFDGSGQACLNTQNSKFVIFLQYLKKFKNDEVYFLDSKRHEKFLQGDTNILDVFGQIS